MPGHAQHLRARLGGAFDMYGQGREADGTDEYQPIFYRISRFRSPRHTHAMRPPVQYGHTDEHRPIVYRVSRLQVSEGARMQCGRPLQYGRPCNMATPGEYQPIPPAASSATPAGGIPLPPGPSLPPRRHSAR